MALLLKHLQLTRQAEFMLFLSSTCLPSFNVPLTEVETYCHALSAAPECAHEIPLPLSL